VTHIVAVEHEGVLAEHRSNGNNILQAD
jgi:hypothetical protein